MAIIHTIYGDFNADISVTKDFMDAAKIEFDIPVSNELAQYGSFNSWRPFTVRINDSSINNTGRYIDFACWSINPESQKGSLHITSYDAAKWLERRSSTRITTDTKTSGEHILDFLAYVQENREERIAYTVEPQSDPSCWISNQNQLNTIQWGQFWASANPATNLHSVAYRSLYVYIPDFITLVDPQKVSIRLVTRETGNVQWNNQVQISKDDGQNWLALHNIPMESTNHETIIDVTNDTTWLAADLANLRIRIVEQANRDTTSDWFNVFLVSVLVDFGTVNDNWPIVANNVEISGEAIQLPDERKTIREWLDYLVDETGYEWEIQSDYNTIGLVGFSWKTQIGEQFSSNVYYNGSWKQFSSLEEDQLIGSVSSAGFDGEAIYSQIRVSASGQSDYVVRNEELANDIGIHEYFYDAGEDVTLEDMQKIAEQKLDELTKPRMLFKFDIPRLTGLWSAIKIGNTAIARFSNAPIKTWSGIIRIIAWDLSESTGILTISALSVSDDAQSFQALGKGYQVQSSTTSRKHTPLQRERRKSAYVQWIISKLSRA